jgi:hypothetical protein
MILARPFKAGIAADHDPASRQRRNEENSAELIPSLRDGNMNSAGSDPGLERAGLKSLRRYASQHYFSTVEAKLHSV